MELELEWGHQPQHRFKNTNETDLRIRLKMLLKPEFQAREQDKWPKILLAQFVACPRFSMNPMIHSPFEFLMSPPLQVLDYSWRNHQH